MEGTYPSPPADPGTSEAPVSDIAEDETLKAMLSLARATVDGFGNPISRSLDVTQTPMPEETIARLFAGPYDRKQQAMASGISIIGNTTRSYSNEIAQSLQRISAMDHQDLQSETDAQFVLQAVQDVDIARKLADLNCDIDHLQALGKQLMTHNYINLQSVLGMTVTETHAQYLCAMILIMRYHGLRINDIDLQSCNGFLDCWDDRGGNRVSFVHFLASELNAHIDWPVRIIAYQHQTTLDGKRVIHPDGYEWQAHYLFDRVRVYTRAGPTSEGPSSIGLMLQRFMTAICESCSDDQQLGGVALDSFTNCLTAVGLVCTKLRNEAVQRGLSRVDARHQVAKQLCEEGSQCKEYPFTSRASRIVGELAFHTFRQPDQFWDPNETWNPHFTGSILERQQLVDLISRALRAAVLGQAECFQNCLSVVPAYMCLEESHPNSDHWAFVEFSGRIETIEKAICEGHDAEINEARLNRYRDYLERTEAYSEGEDPSYHLGPPGTQFAELNAKCTLTVGNSVTADKGQGLRIEAQSSSTFSVRIKGSLAGKLVVQGGILRFEKGNRLERAVKKLKLVKMFAVGLNGVQVEFRSAQDVLSGSAEGISRAALSGAFGASPAVWLIAQMTQGSLSVKSPLPGYLRGIVEAEANGIKAPPYIGHSVLSKLQFLTDKKRLCLNIETTSKVLVLKKGGSMYEVSADACDLPAGSWWTCTVRGLKPLG